IDLYCTLQHREGGGLASQQLNPCSFVSCPTKFLRRENEDQVVLCRFIGCFGEPIVVGLRRNGCWRQYENLHWRRGRSGCDYFLGGLCRTRRNGSQLRLGNRI